MKNSEKTKMIFGYILIGYSIIGIMVAISYQFDLDIFSHLDYRTFGPREGGGASNTPIFHGLSAIAGAILLASVKKEEKGTN